MSRRFRQASPRRSVGHGILCNRLHLLCWIVLNTERFLDPNIEAARFPCYSSFLFYTYDQRRIFCMNQAGVPKDCLQTYTTTVTNESFEGICKTKDITHGYKYKPKEYQLINYNLVVVKPPDQQASNRTFGSMSWTPPYLPNTKQKLQNISLGYANHLELLALSVWIVSGAFLRSWLLG